MDEKVLPIVFLGIIAVCVLVGTAYDVGDHATDTSEWKDVAEQLNTKGGYLYLENNTSPYSVNKSDDTHYENGILYSGKRAYPVDHITAVQFNS